MRHWTERALPFTPTPEQPCLVCEGWGAYCDDHRPRPEQDEAVRLLDNLTDAVRTILINEVPSDEAWRDLNDAYDAAVAHAASPPPVPAALDGAEPWEGDTGEYSGTNIQVAPDYEQAALDHSWPDSETVPAALDVERLRGAMERAIANSDDAEAIAREYNARLAHQSEDA